MRHFRGLASKNAVAEMQALKSENKGLWNALKRFFTSFFNKINKLYKETPPDTPEAKYIADMYKAVKTIRDAFMEGAVEAGKKANAAISKQSAIDGIKPYTSAEITSIKSNSKFIVAETMDDVIAFFNKSTNDKTNEATTMFVGKISDETAELIEASTGINARNKSIALNSSDLRHLYKEHGNSVKENLRGQEAISADNFETIIAAIATPDTITAEKDEKSGAISVIFKKEIKGKTTAITVFSEKKKAFTLKTARITKKEQHISQPTNAEALITTPEAKSSMNAVSKISIAQTAKEVKTVLKKSRATSEQDSTYLDAVKRGDMETAQKMVDEAAKKAGYTYKGMHGTDADFNKFDYSYISDDNKLGLGFYFTNNEKLQFKYDYEKNAYLKFENPIFDNNPILDDILRREADLRESGLSQKETLKKIQSEFGYDGIIAEYNRRALVAFNPEQIKSADAVTYDDNGNVIPLSERFNEKSKDIRYKARSVDKNTSKRYNSFGWVRANEVLSADEYSNFTSEFSKAKTSKEYSDYKSSLNEYMIAVGKMYGDKEGVKNKIVFAKGTIANPEITRIIEIDADNETFLSEKRLNIYEAERRGIRTQTLELFKLYNSTDYGYGLYQQRSSTQSERHNNQLGADRGTGSGTAQKVKEILFDDEGNEVSRTIRHKSRSTVTSGQYEQMKANLSHSKVYSKKSAMEFVSKIAPGIRNRSFEDLSTRLWEGLNTYTALDDKIAFATDMAEIFVDKMVVDTLVKHSEWDSAVERMAYLKPAIGTIDFRAEDVSELKYMLDKNYASLRSRWGYKTPSDGSFKRAYGLDEFISDLSREMPGMEHLAEMHPAEAFICCKSRFAY